MIGSIDVYDVFTQADRLSLWLVVWKHLQEENLEHKPYIGNPVNFHKLKK